MGNYRVSVILIFVLFTMANGDLTVSLGRANVNEWFSKKIKPQMFNLTLEQPDQFEYSFSLKDYPDLPSWMRFMYSTEYNSGFLYGTPPEQVSGHEVSGIHCVFIQSVFTKFILTTQKKTNYRFFWIWSP